MAWTHTVARTGAEGGMSPAATWMESNYPVSKVAEQIRSFRRRKTVHQRTVGLNPVPPKEHMAAA